MALSQNEDFAIWYIRTTFLNNCKDGIGERLVNVNSSILNTPGFRAAGWSSDQAPRTHSPPIPTAITTDYFQSAALQREQSRDEDDEEGGMVTGRKSNDTIGPGINLKRRRRKEQMDEDDSSDLSDDSDDEPDNAQRAAQQIRFAKMPARDRSDSSPVASPNIRTGPDVTVTSPSKPRIPGRQRTGSLGAVEAVKARARADTATSSDLSSENEVDPSYFQRRQINTRKSGKSMLLAEDADGQNADVATSLAISQVQDDSDAESIGSDLSSDLGEAVDSASLLHDMNGPRLQTSLPHLEGMAGSGPHTTSESPRKLRSMALLQALPPPRPISYIQPVSLLSKALKVQNAAPSNPVRKFAALSGKGSPNPLWIKIYAPFSENPESPFEMPLQRSSKDGDPVIVAEAIGLSLWRYGEENLKPRLTAEQLNVNKWSLRMVEDGEVDFDFPALARTKAITDFTSNNNRGARGRSRERPFDEFALVEATGRDFEMNKRETPTFSPTVEETESDLPTSPLTTVISNKSSSSITRPPVRTNPMLAGQPFASALTNTSLTPADKPVQATTTSTPRLGTLKTVRIRHFDLDVASQSTTMEISTDSYIAEILDYVCKRWNYEKAGFVLKVAGTNTVAPLDRTVEALGTRSDLELVRKRFGIGPTSLTGSPGSASPNAPLLLDIQGPRKGKKGQPMLHPLAQKQDLMTSASNFKKYNVIRKQLTSFTQNNQRVLVFDGDFLHNMPADTGKTFDSNVKTNSFAFADVLKCKISTKHSKLIRLLVRRTSESKRYDFEARSSGEAQEIVDEITKEMKHAQAQR